MKKWNLSVLLLVLLTGCAWGGDILETPVPTDSLIESTTPTPTGLVLGEDLPRITAVPIKGGSGQIYLYGERHGDAVLYEMELELWKGYYAQGMRHLFLEYPCYTAEFLNLWMKAEDDTILEELYRDWNGSAAQNEENKAFFQAIKEECPETVFHGVDVGHQYQTTGARYLRYLEENGRQNSVEYQQAAEVREQGKRYYKDRQDAAYRETMLTENFLQALEALEGESVMGIFGSAHTDITAMNYGSGEVPTLAGQLYAQFGEAVQTVSLTRLPRSLDTITIQGKDYPALYFGEQDISNFSERFVSRAFWQLEGAYEAFKDCPVTGDVLPYNNYPLDGEGQVFVLDYTLRSGEILRTYYRSDGTEWEGLPTTVEFTVD